MEWKSWLDLTKASGRFSVARAILGFANREVEASRKFFEGVAYMVVGAEPGTVAGVTVTDTANLEQGVRTYLDGPRWTPFYVQVGDEHVLVIAVEAPRAKRRSAPSTNQGIQQWPRGCGGRDNISPRRGADRTGRARRSSNADPEAA